MPKNAECKVSDTELCNWLDKDCKDCYVHGLKRGEEAEKVLDDFRVTLSLLPDDFDTLQGGLCCFCKEEKKPRAGYAVIDLAHTEPESTKGMFFGLGKKVRQRIGSLMPVSISICRDCRRGLRLAEYLKWLSIAVFVAIAIGICFIPAVNENPVLPYGVVIVGFALGYLLGKVASNLYVKAKSRTMAFNVFEIPVCREMQENNWFTMQDNGPISRFIMSRKSFTKKLSRLCGTGMEAAGEIEPTASAKD
jgi:hypothetical protein